MGTPVMALVALNIFTWNVPFKMTSSFADLKDPRQYRGKDNKKKLGRIK